MWKRKEWAFRVYAWALYMHVMPKFIDMYKNLNILIVFLKYDTGKKQVIRRSTAQSEDLILVSAAVRFDCSSVCRSNHERNLYVQFVFSS